MPETGYTCRKSLEAAISPIFDVSLEMKTCQIRTLQCGQFVYAVPLIHLTQMIEGGFLCGAFGIISG